MGLDKAAESALNYLLSKEKLVENGDICYCSTKHVPKPLRFYKVKSYYLCPTAYQNVLLYLELTMVWGTDGCPGSVRKHFGDYVQQVANNLIAYNLI